VETFRCPTCIGVLTDVHARRCNQCGQNIRRRRPRVLGENHRIGATDLPIDRWMLARLHGTGRKSNRNSLPPVAWHGRFATSPLAEPDFSATPPVHSTPLAPPTAASAPDITQLNEPIVEAPIDIPPTIGALALDVYTRPVTPEEIAEFQEADDAATAFATEPAEAPLPFSDLFDAQYNAPLNAPLSEPVNEPPEPNEFRASVEPAPTFAPAPPPPAVEVGVGLADGGIEARASFAPANPQRTPMLHSELDPEVRAIVDELYQQARAELSGSDLGFFAPLPEIVPDTGEHTIVTGEQPIVMDEPPVLRADSALDQVLEAEALAIAEDVVADASRPRNRSGWVAAAFITEEERRKLTD
jgi:hypothetical protein